MLGGVGYGIWGQGGESTGTDFESLLDLYREAVGHGNPEFRKEVQAET